VCPNYCRHEYVGLECIYKGERYVGCRPHLVRREDCVLLERQRTTHADWTEHLGLNELEAETCDALAGYLDGLEQLGAGSCGRVDVGLDAWTPRAHPGVADEAATPAPRPPAAYGRLGRLLGFEGVLLELLGIDVCYGAGALGARRGAAPMYPRRASGGSSDVSPRRASRGSSWTRVEARLCY